MPSPSFRIWSALSLGGHQGNGRQFVSWIHDTDFARAVEFLIDRDDLDGPVNLASPNPLPNREFMAILREAWDMPNGLPLPAPLLALGALVLRTETELVLKSRRVIPTRLLDAGFHFDYPKLARRRRRSRLPLAAPRQVTGSKSSVASCKCQFAPGNLCLTTAALLLTTGYCRLATVSA